MILPAVGVRLGGRRDQLDSGGTGAMEEEFGQTEVSLSEN